jgi:opacity protein-like surface antigen
MNDVRKVMMVGLVLLLIGKNGKAQYSSASKYELGVDVGTLIYQGDLSTSRFGFTKTLRPALGISLSRKLDNYFSLRGNFTVGKLVVDEAKQSSPAYHQTRRFQFKTPINELSAMLLWNVPGENSHRLTYYFMAGAGLNFTKVKRDWSRTDTTNLDHTSAFAIGLNADTLHRTPRVVPVLPVGAGLRLQLSPAWALRSEFVYRFTSSDYLDGFSRSVNHKTKDQYYGLSIGISYRFGADPYRCPKVN